MSHPEKPSFEMTFNVGPSQLGPGVADDIREALQTGVCSISHRSQRFIEFYRKARTEVFRYFSLPPDWDIYFVGTGSEAMETATRGLIAKRSSHHVCGSFSKRAHMFAEMIGRDAILFEKPDMDGFHGQPDALPAGTDCVFFTKTETATGVQTSWDYIRAVRDRHPDVTIVCDVVSATPCEPLSPELADLYFFSVQKGVGLPSGLGVILCSPKALAKAKDLQKRDLDVGANHSLPLLDKYAKQDYNHDTPNVLGIFLLGRAFERFNQRGLDTIRRESRDKAARLYAWLEKSEIYFPAVPNSALRSENAVGVKWRFGLAEANVLAPVRASHFETGVGYGALRGSMIRIANFPVHTLKDHERLISALEMVRVPERTGRVSP